MYLVPQVLVLVFTSQVLVQCPSTTKSLKTVKDSVFCKQSVTYEHLKSINSVTAIVAEVILLIDISK